MKKKALAWTTIRRGVTKLSNNYIARLIVSGMNYSISGIKSEKLAKSLRLELKNNSNTLTLPEFQRWFLNKKMELEKNEIINIFDLINTWPHRQGARPRTKPSKLRGKIKKEVRIMKNGVSFVFPTISTDQAEVLSKEAHEASNKKTYMEFQKWFSDKYMEIYRERTIKQFKLFAEEV